MTDQRVREKFEAWISAPPMELCVDRFNADHPSWPNCYKNYKVHLAWDAWQAAWREGMLIGYNTGVDKFASAIREKLK